jgi:hypothetical protein
LRNANFEESQGLVRRMYNQLEDEDVTELLDVGPRVFRRGAGTVSIERLQRLLKERMGRSDIGSPVCVSAVRLRDESVSLLAIGSRGTEVDTIRFPGIRSAPDRIRSTYSLWLDPARKSTHLSIPWPKNLQELAGAIYRLATEVDPNCRWIALALQPDLASLPWSALLGLYIPEVVVSLIPSLSWFATAMVRTEPVTRTVTFKLSPAGDLSTLRTKIEDQKKLFQTTASSCGVVLGHGELTEEDIPSIAAGKGTLTLRDWISLAGHRILIVHSCHSGRVSTSFPSDLGGLPGLSLSLGCRVLLAPVTEVHANILMRCKKTQRLPFTICTGVC